MRIGYLSTIYHTSFILKSGKFHKGGLDGTEWTLYPTGPGMMEAFKSGEINLGYVGLPPVMMGISKGMKLKCVAGGHVEGTVMIAQDSYQSYSELGSLKSTLKQFQGKTIGTLAAGSIHDVIIRSLIKGLDISIKNYPWADFIPDAILDGEIAAGVGTPSLATAASLQFDSKVVIPPSKLWPYNPSYGIVVQEDLISRSPDFIVNFLKAHENACNLLRKHPEQAAKIAASEMGVVDKDFVLKTYSISPRYCAALPPEYVKSTMGFIQVLKNLGYMEKDLKVKDVFDLSFIEKIHREKAHY
jgi:NitT/TauT family transport system substrate-binding protein